MVFSVPTGTDDILFPDNAKAIFGGCGSDLQISHNGSNSQINDLGTETQNKVTVPVLYFSKG